MYFIPKNLEVKLAFPPLKIHKWTFKILVQDITFLVAFPLMIPYLLQKYHLIPNFTWMLILCGIVVEIFTFYLVVWYSPTPKLNNFGRFMIWCQRPKSTYFAPATGSRGILNQLEKE